MDGRLWGGGSASGTKYVHGCGGSCDRVEGEDSPTRLGRQEALVRPP